MPKNKDNHQDRGHERRDDKKGKERKKSSSKGNFLLYLAIALGGKMSKEAKKAFDKQEGPFHKRWIFSLMPKATQEQYWRNRRKHKAEKIARRRARAAEREDYSEWDSHSDENEETAAGPAPDEEEQPVQMENPAASEASSHKKSSRDKGKGKRVAH